MTEPQIESAEKNSGFEKEIRIKINLKVIFKAAILLVLVIGIAFGFLYSHNMGYKKGYSAGEAAGKRLGANVAKITQADKSKNEFIDGYTMGHGDALDWWVKSEGFYIFKVEKGIPFFLDIKIKDWNKKTDNAPKYKIMDSIKMVPGQKYFTKGDTIWLNN